jgi:hypothetical protein
MNSADWYLDGKTEMIDDQNVFFTRSGKGESLKKRRNLKSFENALPITSKQRLCINSR